MSFGPGDRFGRYELAELLGKGGMGEVYRAHDTLLHRRVAVKVLRPGAAGSLDPPSATDGAARILREARAAAGLAHPNAIAIYDVGEVDGVPFLAMEFIPGRTLRAFVGDNATTLARRLRWLIDVARALGAAHQLGLVHRDIKPENVMVGDDGIVKVLDFGIARRTNLKPTPETPTIGTGPLGTLTADGVVVGTPYYMAPEQMRGEPLDGRADQFAWGVVAYELLTGELPWQRELGALQVVSQILSREVDPPRTKNAEIPAAVDAAIRMALNKAAKSRFASMDDLADELEPHAAAPGGMTGRSDRRRSLPAAGGDMAMAPTQSLPPGGTDPRSDPSIPSTRTQLATQAAAPAKRVAWPVVAVACMALIAIGLGVSRAIVSPRGSIGARDAAPAAETESQLSTNAEATAAYHAGMQAMRDAALQTASQQFDRAIALDPLFAAAHLRRALLTYEVLSAGTRQDLQAARNSRAALGEHDRTILEAMEPWTFTPPDLRESQRRFEDAVRKNPGNADFLFSLGWTLHHTRENKSAVEAFDGVLARDPAFAMAWCMKGRERVLLDDVEGAIDAFGQCLKISPAGTSCLEDLSELQAGEGKCEDTAATVRRLISVAPDVPSSYGALAEALFSLDEPVDAVRAAFQQKWERLPVERRETWKLRDEATLAVLTGRFDDADRLVRALAEATASAPDESTHFRSAYWRVLIEQELGKNAEARSLASEYLRERSAWAANEFGAEPAMYIYAAQLQMGALAPGEFAKLRDAWVERDRKRIERVGFVNSAYAGSIWSVGYALAVARPSDAMAALAVRPDVHPFIDAWVDKPYFDEPVGRTYLLAGRVDEAIATLRRASGYCAIGSVPDAAYSTWAAFDLGQALEVRGDTAGACAAYRRVLSRWGSSALSRTAAKARTRSNALRCAP